jgi:hypothetical protein
MKSAYWALLSALCVGCAGVSEKAADWTTVSLGADSLQAVQIDESVMLAAQPLPACLPIVLNLQKEDATVTLQPSGADCALTLHQPKLVMFDKDEIYKARQKAGPFDVDGIRSGSVELMKLELLDGDRQPLALAQYVDAVTVQVEGETLLDKMSPAEIEREPLVRQLPTSLIDKLKQAVKTDEVATVDVVLTLWLRADAIPTIPTALSFSLVLQPELEVSLLEAL